jgi:hypothetical protein
MSPYVRTACVKCSTRMTGVIAIPSLTAPTAGRASPSFAIFPTTGRARPWRCFPCARHVLRSTKTRWTAAFTPSPTPAGSADLGWNSGISLASGSNAAIPSSKRSPGCMPDGRRGKRAGRISSGRRCHESRGSRSAAQRKRRVEKPFAVMVPDLQAAEEICELDDAARTVCSRCSGPLFCFPKRSREA